MSDKQQEWGTADVVVLSTFAVLCTISGVALWPALKTLIRLRRMQKST